MSAALPTPSFAGLATQWTAQPLAIAAVLGLAAWYWISVRAVRRAGQVWSPKRSAVFALGLVLGAWTTCGFLQVYVGSLFWIWTSQQLTLLLIVPYVLLAGRPIELARARVGADGVVDRFVRSPLGRLLSNPLVGPALVPILSAVLFFGPLPSWAIDTPWLGWLLALVVVAIGGLIVLPLVVTDDRVSSLAVGLSLAIGSLELVIDAVPGIALRLHRSLSTSYFAHRAVHVWTPGALHDQQIAGATLWCVAELIDLPFLVLVYRRWVRADARDAAAVDAVLEAERHARAALREGPAEPDGPPETDVPWWLSDPAMRRRLGK